MLTSQQRLSLPTPPARQRLVLEMKDLSDRFTKIAHPWVKTALEVQLMEVGAAAWREESESVLRSLLRDPSSLPSEALHPKLLDSLKAELDNPTPPNEDELLEHASKVGTVMASSWLQFLALALRERDELHLDDTLLPQRNEVREELWLALRGSLNPLAVGVDEAPAILKSFAEEVVAHSDGVTLPMGIALHVDGGRPGRYIARRR